MTNSASTTEIARVTDDVRAQLNRYGLTDLVGDGEINDTIDCCHGSITEREVLK